MTPQLKFQKTALPTALLAALLALSSPSFSFAANAKTAAPAEAKTEAALTADGKVRFNFQDAEITKVLEAYAKVSGQKFVVDPSVRGKITIYSPQPVTLEEAFSLLSTALALNQFAIIENGDTMTVMSARNAQRSGIQTYTELPPLKPEKLVTMVFTLKHISAEEVNKRLRILPSKDGEMTPFEPANKLIVTDWVSSIVHIAKMIDQLDQPATKTK